MIALVISIIVMLILAGVSISAIVGDDGILSKTTYASFLSEMSAVEEAVQMWKATEIIEAQGDEVKAIPANGLCKANDLTSAERLVGEVGYYRVWSLTLAKPSIDILSSADTFNSSFESELVFYPAGVQDLYYLNNDALEIKGHKTYLIDATTGMIYSMSGISLKGVRCYSSNMAKAVMSGNIEQPLFAEAEVSGTGSGEKLAGNVQSEYLMDENGNYILDENGNKIKNPDYNPNGFRIISSEHSENIYKLYNNGDLYAKGIKGTQLNTTSEKMQKIDAFAWHEFTVPTEIGEYEAVIPAVNTMFVLDKEGYLWAWGDNASNKLGLTKEQQVNYTGREPIRLDIDGKKVKKVWGFIGQTYVLTTDNKLYGCGSNDRYQLGLGHNGVVDYFQMIDIPNPEKIKQIYMTQEQWTTYIEYEDNTFYSSGERTYNIVGNNLSPRIYTKFIPIWNGYVYKINNNIVEKDLNFSYNSTIDIDQDIKKIVTTNACGIMILKNDNSIWNIGGSEAFCEKTTFDPDTGKNTTSSVLKYGELCEIPVEFGGTDVKDIYSVGYGILIEKNNGEVWAANWVYDSVGTNGTTRSLKKVELPDDLINKGIKEIYTIGYADSQGAVFYLTNTNELYASANSNKITGGSKAPNQIAKIESPLIESMYNVGHKVNKVSSSATIYTYGTNLFLGKDGKLYALGNKNVIFRNDILEKSWYKVASNVVDISIGYNNSIAYIDNNKDVYVAGEDSRMLGLNSSNASIVRNFVKITDEKIVGKAIDVEITYGQIYVITVDKKLYGSGIFSADGSTGWPNDRWPGWDALENNYAFVEIKDKVDVYGGNMYDKFATSEGKLYFWGGDLLNYHANQSRSPKERNITNLDTSNIKKINTNRSLGIILDNDGNVYLNNSSYANKRFYYNVINEYFNNKKIIDFAMIGETAIFLDEDNCLWGFGSNKYLGINDSSNNITNLENSKKFSINNVQEISAGNGWFIAVTNTGKVYGTGLNTYGILGRWIGVDRNTPNSRYQTAFEWVECPELEI